MKFHLGGNLADLFLQQGGLLAQEASGTEEQWPSKVWSTAAKYQWAIKGYQLMTESPTGPSDDWEVTPAQA